MLKPLKHTLDSFGYDGFERNAAAAELLDCPKFFGEAGLRSNGVPWHVGTGENQWCSIWNATWFLN